MKKEEFVVYLDQHGDVENLSYLRSEGQAKEATVEVKIVQSIPKGPVPELLQPIKLVDGQVPVPEVSI